MKRSSVFYIESPFQLIVMSQDIQTKDILLLRPTSKSTNEQLIATITDLKIQAKYYVIYPRNSIEKLFSFVFIYFILIIPVWKSVNIGYYKSIIGKNAYRLRFLKKIRFYDDGLATLKMPLVYLNSDGISIKTVFHSLMPKFINIEPNNIFTNFLTEDLEFEDAIHIIGSKYVECGFMTCENYELILDKIVNKYSRNKIYYYLHRDECSKKLNKFRSQMILQKENLPLELIFKRKDRTGTHVIGIGSSALLSLRLMKFHKIQYFGLENYIKPDLRANVRETEQFFRLANLKEFDYG